MQAARYDGIADWYDEKLDSQGHRQRVLTEHLWQGQGPCLDVGCGTGRDLQVIAQAGWTPVGVEISADQLRLARGRGGHLVQGDAQRLPFADASFPAVVSSWISTDVERFDLMVAEIARVLQPGGRFLFYGAHPCFNGPHVEVLKDQSRVVRGTYRQARRHTTAPGWSDEGIRVQAGGMRHVPLAEFLGAFIGAGLGLEQVFEPDDEPVPNAIVVIAGKPG